MAEYVKHCPQCGRTSPESAVHCGCGFFLGLVSPVPAQGSGSIAEPVSPAMPESQAPAPEPVSGSGQNLEPVPGTGFRLIHLETGRVFPVQDGDTVGQDHPTSQAQVRLAGLAGVNFVSRHHCRFFMTNGAWFITALASALNPTTVNDLPLASGGTLRVHNGDLVRLANVSFKVQQS
jgi:hypothetical protein